MKNEEINKVIKDTKIHTNNKIADVKPDDVAEASVSLVKLVKAGIRIWKDLMKK